MSFNFPSFFNFGSSSWRTAKFCQINSHTNTFLYTLWISSVYVKPFKRFSISE